MEVRREAPYDHFPRMGTTYLRNEWPDRRPLKIFARDPLSLKTAGNVAIVDIPNEDLRCGPTGARIQVVDYDGTYNRFYAPVDLNEGPILMRNGLDPSESDPRFHQQMVYAVAMRVLENFERALGRGLTFRGRQLKLLPHAFHGANAFFDPPSNSVLFGYFNADVASPGMNLPGQIVFSCLSHDIVAHEVTHAILYRLRQYFNEPTNRDVLAFHEGFADIVAIFQHFTFPDVLHDAIQKGHGDLRSVEELLELARQFGHGTGRSQALRSALEENGPNPADYKTVVEPHSRGSLLVAAIFDTFFATYQARIHDILRVATGGTGRLPEGDLHPDLVAILASEASKAAQSILSMCIRAIEFLPPVDVTFGDYLRALVTADHELFPEDKLGQRAALIEAFRVRGIYPEGVKSLSEESLIWEGAERALPPIDSSIIGRLMTQTVLGPRRDSKESQQIASLHSTIDGVVTTRPADDDDQDIAELLQDWATVNAGGLDLHPDASRRIAIRGFHPIMRVGSNGRVRVDIVCQFIQERPVSAQERLELGGLRLRAGTTVVFSQSGSVRHLIPKPLKEEDRTRHGAPIRSVPDIKRFVAQMDSEDDILLWREATYLDRRMVERANFALLDKVLDRQQGSGSEVGAGQKR